MVMGRAAPHQPNRTSNGNGRFSGGGDRGGPSFIAGQQPENASPPAAASLFAFREMLHVSPRAGCRGELAFSSESLLPGGSRYTWRDCCIAAAERRTSATS